MVDYTSDSDFDKFCTIKKKVKWKMIIRFINFLIG